MIRNNIVTYAAILGGAFLVLVGFLGFCFPIVFGLHLSALTNFLHLASGALALYFGLKSASLAAARTFCQAMGALYALAGGAGLVGAFALSSGASMLEIMEHLAHLLVGAGFVAAALIQPGRPTLFSQRP